MATEQKKQKRSGRVEHVHTPKTRTAGQRLRDEERKAQATALAAQRRASLKREQDAMNAVRSEPKYSGRTMSDDECRTILRARRMASLAKEALNADDVKVAGEVISRRGYRFVCAHATPAVAEALKTGNVEGLNPRDVIEIVGYLFTYFGTQDARLNFIAEEVC